MANLRKVRAPNNINPKLPSAPRTPPLSESLDATELKIEQLNPENGNVEQTLVLRGTHVPFQTLDPYVTQAVNKFYYPGGPPNRTPTVQILGSMDEDIQLRGRFKASKLETNEQKDEPLQIARVIERMVREGKPCRLQIGYYIKYVLLKDVSLNYKNNSDIGYNLRILILGDNNPVSGEENLQEDDITAKVFESEAEEDVTNEVTEYENEILALRDEVELFGYEFPIKRGGILGFIDDVFNTLDDIEATINDAINVLDEYASEIEKTAQRIEKALLTVERLRSKLYRIQNKLFSAYSTIKNAANPKRLLDSINVFDLIHDLINNFQISLKRSEDIIRTDQIVLIGQTYVVNENDTWQSIAIRFYNNSDRWEDIRNLNPSDVEIIDPASGFITLREGAVILIPK